MYDYLVVGAGLFGAAFARAAKDQGKSCLIIEKREHIAGNCFDENYSGCYVNRYGGHIFHTNSPWNWDFVNRFATWRQYEHRVKVCYQGRIYSFPPNMATFDQLGMRPGPEAEQKVREMFFEGYTAKQWRRALNQVPASVLARIPIHYTYDDRYFSDRWQGLPEHGYTRLVQEMLDGIPVELNVDFLSAQDYWRNQADRVVYSGSLDALYGFELGRLEYRSLRFDTMVKDTDDYQGCATLNYPEIGIPWTRVMEWKHFGWRGEPKGQTVITVEYPQSDGDPYYPIDDELNRELHRAYAQRAATDHILFGGRLGSYKYFNMDQVIGQALSMARSQYD